MSMEHFFHHTIGPNNPQGLSDGKKIIFCMQKFKYVHIGLKWAAQNLRLGRGLDIAVLNEHGEG